MSGRIVREVLDEAARLRAAGIAGNALQALVPIAEECRDGSRLGSVPYARVAEWLGKSERTAERAVATLVKAGVVMVARRGGGRFKAMNQYYLPPLAEWQPAGTPAIHGVAGVPSAVQPPLMAGVPSGDPISRHSWDGGSSDEPPTASPATHGMAGVPGTAGANSRQNGVLLPPSMDVRCSVVPEVLLGGTPDVTTDRVSVPGSATPPKTISPSSTATASPPAGSYCGRTDCRAPRSCGWCAAARRVAEARRLQAIVDEAEETRRAAEARRAAAADCPLGCDDDGYLGRLVCGHDPAMQERNRRGRALVDAQLRRPRSRADVERARQDVLAELDAVQVDLVDDPSQAPRPGASPAARPDQHTDQREHVA